MPRGGWRPGAGRKSKAAEVSQQSRRSQIQAWVTDDRWQHIVDTAIDQAIKGDPTARAWLTPYVAGKVPDEINANVSQVIEVVYSDSNSANPALPPSTTPRPAADHR